jgi:hypothetical protein
LQSLQYFCIYIAASDDTIELVFDSRQLLVRLLAEISAADTVDAALSTDSASPLNSIQALKRSVRRVMTVHIQSILGTRPRGGASRSRSRATSSRGRSPVLC